MKNFKFLLNIAFIATTLLFIGCNKDDESIVKKQITLQDLVVAIDENTTNGQTIGTVLTDENEASGFSITSQTPAGALSIDSGTGELTVADATLFDFETNPVITATVSVEDGVNTATVTINLNDVAEIGVQDLTIDFDENPTNGQTVGTVLTDGSGVFSITSQTPAGALSIDPNTGELTVADASLFDFETNPVITATVSVEDGINTATVTINLTNVAEINDLTIDFDENPSNGQVVGTVPNDGSGALSITSQTPAGALSINPSTGELTVADASLFDFETNPTITATVEVDGATAPATVTVNLNNIHEVGDFKFGGVIFWVNGAGNEGLICAVNDQSTGIQWFNGSDGNTGASGTTIGTGQANTTAIVNYQGVGSYPAQLCDDLSLNSYDDWFLPSIDELEEMYNNKTVINASSLANSGTSFVEGSEYYWSSTEADNSKAFVLQFVNGSIIGGFKSSTSPSVRAVRAWTDF